MKRFVEGTDRGQSTLFPESLEDWIGEDNPVRVIDVFVDELDLAELGFNGVDPEATGRPSYHPSVLLKLYIYGYLNRVYAYARAFSHGQDPKPTCRRFIRSPRRRAVAGTVAGSAYFVGGLGMTVLFANDMVVVPIRSGMGLRTARSWRSDVLWSRPRGSILPRRRLCGQDSAPDEAGQHPGRAAKQVR